MSALQARDIKKRQVRLFVGVVVGLVLLIILGLWLSDPNRGKPNLLEVRQREAQKLEQDYTVKSGSVTAEENWRAQSEKEIGDLRRQNRNLEQTLQQISRQLENLQNSDDESTLSSDSPAAFPSTSALPPPPPPPSPPSAPPASSAAGLADRVPGDALPRPPAGRPQAQDDGRTNQIEVIEFGGGDEPGEEERKNVSHYLPAGAFSRVVLMSGLDAPTGGQGTSNPVPVLLRVMDLGTLPNFFESQIQDCHITASGYGEISSERAQVRTDKLSCVLSNGDVVEASLKGYLVGEDGKAGMRGRLVSKQGSVIAKSLISGIFSGASNSINQQAQQTATSPLGTVTTVDPNKVYQAGAAEGASTAFEKVADYYLARANEMYPIIEVDAKRIGEVVLTDGVELGTDIIGHTTLRGDK